MLNEIGALRNEIGQLWTEMHAMETRLRLEIQSEGNKLRAELHKEIAALRGDVENIAWKVAGLLIIQTIVIVAAVKLLPRRRVNADGSVSRDRLRRASGHQQLLVPARRLASGGAGAARGRARP
ncbi:MAG: hypothetical protein K0S35_4000 [Geminicoccaceae bacterium]|nr:hypothetical protein [Geminicoccaceae bacterium]